MSQFQPPYYYLQQQGTSPAQQWQQQQPPYTPLPPVSQDPPPPKKKRSKAWIWVILALFVGIVIGYGAHTPLAQTPTDNTTTTQATTPQATAKPTKPAASLKWVTTHTFTGNGTKKTAFFTAPDNWKLIWKCDPSSFFNGAYNVGVDVTGADGTVDLAVNTICKAGNTGDSTEEHHGGRVYLAVNSEAAWTLQVQELK